jgi:hypothetical protein
MIMDELSDIKCKCGSKGITLKVSYINDWLAVCPNCRRRIFGDLINKLTEPLEKSLDHNIVSVRIKPHFLRTLLRIVCPNKSFEVTVTFKKYPEITFTVRDARHLIWELESCVLDPYSWRQKNE